MCRTRLVRRKACVDCGFRGGERALHLLARLSRKKIPLDDGRHLPSHTGQLAPRLELLQFGDLAFEDIEPMNRRRVFRDAVEESDEGLVLGSRTCLERDDVPEAAAFLD